MKKILNWIGWGVTVSAAIYVIAASVYALFFADCSEVKNSIKALLIIGFAMYLGRTITVHLKDEYFSSPERIALEVLRVLPIFSTIIMVARCFFEHFA